MSNIRNTENFMNEPHLRHDNELPKGNQSIVKVLSSVHNNLYSVMTPDYEGYLVHAPKTSTNTISLERGSYVVVEKIHEENEVKAKVVKILDDNLITFYKQQNVWPSTFEEDEEDDIDFDVDSFDNDEYYDYNVEEQYIENGNENDSSEEYSLWFVNTNSPEYYYRDGDSIDYNNNNEDEPNNVVSETDSGACSDYDI